MPKFDFYPSFNAGEVSPMVDARTSLDKYRSACRTLENFQILPYGGVIRRPGTEFRGTTKNPAVASNGEVRLIGFNFSTTTRFIIEMGIGYLRFWSGATGSPVTVATPAAWATGNIYSVGNYVTSSGTTYYCTAAHTSSTFATDLAAGRWGAQTILEVPTPYAASHLREIQCCQINDIMYFAHANYPPRKLTRVSDTNWTFEDVKFAYPPLLDSDDNQTKLYVNIATYAFNSGRNYFKDSSIHPPVWSASVSYAVGDFVLAGNNIVYKCITAHTSTATFNATNWTLISQTTIHFRALKDFTANTFPADIATGNISSLPLSSNQMGTMISGTAFTGYVGSQIELKWQNSNLYKQIEIVGNFESETLLVDGAWDFETSGTWGATIQILRVPAEIMQAGVSAGLAYPVNSTTIEVYQPNHGYDSGDRVSFKGDYKQLNAAISSVTTNTYRYNLVTATTLTGYRDVFPENLTQMEIVREYIVDNDKNIITSGTENSLCGLKIVISNAQKIAYNWAASTVYVVGDFVYSGGKTYYCVTAHTSGGSFDATKFTTQQVPNARIDSSTPIIGGVATITAANTINVDKWLGPLAAAGTKTKFWQYGAFNATSGYPRSVCLHEQRLCFGGSKAQPNTIWCSAIGDFENFELGVNASDAVQFTLAASEGNRINWMYSQSELLVGTSGDEWTIGAADSASALSATNVKTRRQASYGSKYMRAAMVNDVLLFVQRNGRKVRELVYELNKDGWVAPDLTLLAEHITVGEIVEVAYQQQPDAILWCVRGDGTLIGMTYERDQKVVGWHRHTIADNADVESVATIYGNLTEDEVWMVVKRTVAGQDYRTIERFPLLWRANFDNQTTASWRYLDGHKYFESGAANRSVAGLTHLNGKTVTIVQNGVVTGTAVVSGGAVTVPATAAGYVGLPYISTLTPMKLDMDLEDGSSQGRKKRIHKVVVRTQKSQGGEVRVNAGQWYDLASTLTTGDQKILTAGTFGFDADVSVQQSDPYPMCILAIEPVWDAYGNE